MYYYFVTWQECTFLFEHKVSDILNWLARQRHLFGFRLVIEWLPTGLGVSGSSDTEHLTEFLTGAPPY